MCPPSGVRGPTRRPAPAILLALSVAACHTATKSTAPHLPLVQQLQHDIDGLLASPALERSFWGVLVRSLADDDTLYSANARKLLMPASNMKIVTLAAAADGLGWNYQYETRVLASGSIDAGGVLAGDLIVVGSGDPSIGGGDDRPTRVFDAWAGQLAALGLRRIDGLSRRLAGTAAEGNARAKTGSLSNVRALSGYVTAADGEPLVFSIIANNFETAASVVDQTTDAIVERLARFRRHGATEAQRK